MRKIIVTLTLFAQAAFAYAQDDLLSALELQTDKPAVEFAEAAFKGSRLINGHTVVTRKINH